MKSTLIVAGDPAARLKLLRILGRYGWWVDAVDSVERALAHLDDAPRDVAMIDWRIGTGSGLSVLSAIRMHPVWQSVPVVMMQGDATLAEVGWAIDCGANDFLAPYFSGEAALKKLDRWVLDKIGPSKTLRC